MPRSRLLGGLSCVRAPATPPAQPPPPPPPAVLTIDDSATPRIDVISHNYASPQRKKKLAERMWVMLSGCGGGDGAGDACARPDTEELQIMVPKPRAGDVCLLAESPYRILRAAETGNIDEFTRVYQSEPSRLHMRDKRGSTAAHLAAAKNNTNILNFISNNGGDLNARDNVGNTPLHEAVKNDACDSVEFLLQHNVDTNVLNKNSLAPIHVAADLNKVKALQKFVQFRSQINVDLGGEHGRTALHFAAIHDNEQCAKILIADLGAKWKQPCNNGYYPIHEAAKNASSRTMEVFLQWGEQKGCTREQMISLFDSEGNVPLHSAVYGGDIRAVQLCLKSGAKISTPQHDMSTPVHLACAQGALDMVKLMFTMQPNERMACLNSCDVQSMTPLHCAAMFDHHEIVEFLVGEGSEIDPLDKEKRSPLLLAASRAAWKTVHALIRLGADIKLTDINNRNVLHLIVMNGGRLEDFAAYCIGECERSLSQLLNEKDHAGCSPLHYASREGHIRSLANLIRLGACINLKNNNNESPLHFAARYGRLKTINKLLDSDKGTFIINESDGEGLTPLHIASREGHIRVVQQLLCRGALLHRDHNGRNPLHLASMSGYTQTIELLHSVHSHLLNQLDKDGNTPLHLATMENKPNAIALLLSMGCELLYNHMDMTAIDYAIYYKFPEAALAMVTHEQRASEVMALRSDRHPCVIQALIAYMPRVLEAVQDMCITKANCKKDSKSFYIKYNFAALCPRLNVDDGQRSDNHLTQNGPLPALNIRYNFNAYQYTKAELEALRLALNDPKYRPEPLAVINAMVAYGRVELLSHPLSQKYLQMKWNSYGKYFHLANVLFYSIYLMFVTIYIFMLVPAVKSSTANNSSTSLLNNGTTNTTNLDAESQPDFGTLVVMYACTVVILVYNILCFTKDLYNFRQQGWHYIVDPSNYVSWVLYILSTLMVVPILSGHFKNIQFSSAAMTVFLSWVELLLLLQRFDQVGIFVVMFLEILQTLLKVLLVFSILIIAFGLALYILLSQGEHLAFRSVTMSMMRTFSMMLGEIDFIASYVEPYYKSTSERQLPFPIATFTILSLFMVLMPILLINLLIGLAVGDIEKVRRNAQLKRLAMQVALHTGLERKLPAFLLEKVDKNELIVYPNTKCKSCLLDVILRKWFCNPFSDEASLDLVLDNNEDCVCEQLEKYNKRQRDLVQEVANTNAMVRLILERLDIKTEADDVDEGVSPGDGRVVPRWSTTRRRRRLRTAHSFHRGN